MSRRHNWISLLIAIPGVCACVVALVGFFRKIMDNGLAFHAGLTPSEYYRTVGRAYGDGFLTGFFLCFFLVLTVAAIAAALARRQRPHLVRRGDDASRPIAFPGSPA